MCRVARAGVGLAIQRMDSHPLHQVDTRRRPTGDSGILPSAVQTDRERVPIYGTAEGATPVTAQAHEPIGTGKSGESQGQLLVASR